MGDPLESIVGPVCLEWGWVTPDLLEACRREEATPAPSNPLRTFRLSEHLVARGLVSRSQMDSLREGAARILPIGIEYALMRREDVILGQILVRSGVARRERVAEALRIQEEAAQERGEVPRLGHVLIQKGYATFSEIEKAVQQRKEKVLLRCAACGAGYLLDGASGPKIYKCRKCTGRVEAEPALKSDVPPEVLEAASHPENVKGKYIVVNVAGRGGMGVIYKAWDSHQQRWVALKTFSGAGGEEGRVRFRAEARTTAVLRHPNIVGVYDVIEDGRRNMIAMQYVEGKTLAGQIFEPRLAARIMRDVARTLSYAHSRGVIHRDLKPHNVMIDREGKPYIMDFGLARGLEGDPETSLWGTVLGTPAYMAPEQAEGDLPKVDERSDVYSLGAVLYEMLVGQPPFKAPTLFEVLQKVTSEAPAPPSRIKPGIPEGLDTIVLRCLEKDKAHRYPSARSLAADLDLFLSRE